MFGSHLATSSFGVTLGGDHLGNHAADPMARAIVLNGPREDMYESCGNCDFEIGNVEAVDYVCPGCSTRFINLTLATLDEPTRSQVAELARLYPRLEFIGTADRPDPIPGPIRPVWSSRHLWQGAAA